MWTPQAKKTIENNVALDKLIHLKIRLAFLRLANSGAVGLPGNQLTEDAWLLGSSPIFNDRELMKDSAHDTFFGLKYLAHLVSLVEKKRIVHLGFLYFTLNRKST